MGRPRIYSVEEAKERRKIQQRENWKNRYRKLTLEQQRKINNRNRTPEYHRRQSAINCEKLKTNYIKYVIAKDTGLKFKNIPMELVELKRIQIQNQRLIKTMS